MPQYNLEQVAGIVQGQLFGKAKQTIHYLLIDSRMVDYPQDSLFFAIKGSRHDGHQYISDLYGSGITCFVVEKLPASIETFPAAGFIVVKNSLTAMQNLAAWHREQFKNTVVAITGSNGKTIVKEWIYQSMHADKHLVRSPKSYNSQVGVPLSLWQIESQHDLAIIEAGISQPGEMEQLEHMIRPDIGIFTNIGEPHQENFLDYAQKCSEKLMLFKNSKKLIYCKDYSVISEAIKRSGWEHIKYFTWSLKTSADLQIMQIVKGDSRTAAKGIFHNQPLTLDIPFVDDASLENSFHLISFLLLMGYTIPAIEEKIKHLSPVAMRLELKRGINNCTIINDSYNSDLGSLSIALDFLNHQNQHEKKTVILSDILQSGRSGNDLYSEISHLLVQKNVKRFIGIGKDLMAHQHYFAMSSEFYLTTADFLAGFRKEHFGNESILLKGSRFFEFERVLKILEEKVHETVLEINLNAMVDNLNYFRSKLTTGTKVVAMVKAFSYGSGSFEIANILQFHRVDYLAVAFADEGVSLREAGITLPIMVMNPESSSFDQIISYQLEPEIYSFQVLEQFAKAVDNHGQFHYPVHMKLDTGMHRLGFMEHDLEQLLKLLKDKEQLQVKSVFSHLAGADETRFDDFTREQIQTFDRMSIRFCQTFPHHILRHILNSAGIERFPQAQYDMVRLGIGLYGISAVDQRMMRQVSTLKTVILQIKQIEVNETVGYSRRFKAANPTTIGIVPIGYADGLHRSLGNGVGQLMVRGKRVPIIGSICMDMCMIDLTGTDAREGDEVIVFGEAYPITEISEQMKTIPYEVFTSVSQRVKRVYYQE
jgi:Alr-MurF fusion protein